MMLELDENARPSIADIINHSWMLKDIGDESVADYCRDRMEEKKAAMKAAGAGGGENSVARRGIGGAGRRGDIDNAEIEREIEKDEATRNLVKVSDYDFDVHENNSFVSTNSPNKIF